MLTRGICYDVGTVYGRGSERAGLKARHGMAARSADPAHS